MKTPSYDGQQWPIKRTDIVGANGNTAEHYERTINGTRYRVNPAGMYALYWSKGAWKENATITNKELINGR